MRKILKFLVLFYCLALAGIWFGRFALIYPFDKTQISPALAGDARLTTVSFNSFDKTPLIVWQAAAKSNKPTIVYFHGNAGNLAGRIERFRRLLDRGYGVVAMAYRGSSGSQGRPNQAIIVKDARWLIENFPSLKNKKLVYYGESLGTGVSAQLSKTHPPSALILEAPFRSLTELAADLLPFFPIRTILDQPWNTIGIIPALDVPLLVLHGSHDKLIPVDHGQSVFDASPSSQKRLKILPDRGHSNLWSVEGQKSIYTFLSKTPKY